MKSKIIITLLILVLLATVVSVDSVIDLSKTQKVDIIIFYGEGCPHCAALHSFLEDLKNKEPDLNVQEYEIYFNQDNRELFGKLTEIYGIEIEGVPTTFIGEDVITGYNSQIGEQIKQKIEECKQESCVNPLGRIEDGGNGLKKTLTIPIVISAAAVDAINPCAFAVLIILLTAILASGSKKRALYAGLVFSLAIFISYFLMGLGLYSAIQASGFIHTFYIVVAILAIILGLFNLKDYLWYGKWFVMEVPLSWRPRMKIILKSVTSIPGAFLVGFIVSIFLLPCTSGPYIVILGLLSTLATRNHAISLLILYNFIFVLPMLLITLGIYFGITTTEKAEQWRQRQLKKLHLIAGIILLLLGIGMILSLMMGWI